MSPRDETTRPTPDTALAAIERGWADAEPPPPDAVAGRPGCGHDEYSFVAEYFGERTWREVDLAGLVDDYPGPHDACLSFMSPAAFRYFVAAFMVLAIREADALDSVTDAAVHALTPPRYRPEIDALARREHERMAAEDPTLDLAALERASGTSREGVRRLRAWWDERVAGFTDPQRAAIVAFLSWATETWGEDLAGEALQHWRG